MKIRLLVLGLLIVLASGAGLAHGNKVHVRGTIEKINADSLQVKTPDGKSVEVKLAASTIYLLHTNENIANGKVGARKLSDEDEPANVKNLAVGDLVVIHATPKGSTLEADEIKFSRPPKPKS
jgi:uncharacterized protein DUF5666